LSSVVIRSIDREAIAQAVASYAAELYAQYPEIDRVIWFGSWVNGLPTPRSDVDICLLLSASNKPLHKRAPAYLPLGFPVGLDLFAYTQAELGRLRTESPAWYAAIAAGREL